MALDDQQTVSALRDIYRIVEAGEKGYATAATNVQNRALKILFKSYAQQRARFKTEIMDELRRRGSDQTPPGSVPGVIHRGRVAIFAAMTIEEANRERVILKEASVGERYAVRAYEKALSHHLPPETREMVQKQAGEVRKVYEQINHMYDKGGKRLVSHLFDTTDEAQRATQALERSGFETGSISRVPLDQKVELYEGKGYTVLETIVSGAFGGLFWGAIIGILAAIGMILNNVPQTVGITSPILFFLLVMLGIMLVGAMGGAFLGAVIGVGISADDTWAYRQSLDKGHTILQVLVEQSRAAEASKIMDQADRPQEQVAGLTA